MFEPMHNKVVTIILSIGILLELVFISIILVHDLDTSKDVYMVCDVYDVTYNGANVEINVILPNGTLLTREMHEDDDLPEGFDEVIIKTNNLDNYSTYQIVGMR